MVIKHYDWFNICQKSQFQWKIPKNEKKKKKRMWTCLVYVKNSKYPIVNIKNEKRKKKFFKYFLGLTLKFSIFQNITMKIISIHVNFKT